MVGSEYFLNHLSRSNRHEQIYTEQSQYNDCITGNVCFGLGCNLGRRAVSQGIISLGLKQQVADYIFIWATYLPSFLSGNLIFTFALIGIHGLVGMS